jgi:hypothetical protein
MDRKSRNLIVAGALIAFLGTALFIIVAALSEGPSPFINGLLMWLSWAAGFVLAERGLRRAGINLFGDPRENRQEHS